MGLSLLLIVIGIALAVLVHYGLGIACILIGLVLLLWPRLTTWRTDRTTRVSLARYGRCTISSLIPSGS
jgi:hypothetical protein